jgi:hypothetical protein
MREFFDLGNNALFVKFVRSRLRKAALLPGLIVVGFVCIGIIILDERMFKPRDPDSRYAQQLFFILQGLILFLMGGSQVAAAVSHINESGIIDFHRVTPMPSKVQTVGILLGAPIREFAFYSITLPFSLFCALAGPVGITDWCKLLLVQLGAALMYYTLAMVAGLSARTGKGASGRFVTMLAALNIAASQMYQFGVYGPTLLTVVPVYEEVFPDQRAAQRQQAMQQQQMAWQQQQAMQRQAMKQQGGKANPNVAPNPVPPPNPQVNQPPQREVTFYSLAVPVVLQSLLFQGTFLTFLFIAASRRIRSARLPLYAKPTALLFYGCIAVLTLGSAWDAARMFQVLGMVYFLTLCAMVLTSSITPMKGDAVKGVQRAWKMSGSRVPLWSDLATNKLVVVLFGAILAAATAAAIALSPDRPLPLRLVLQNDFQPWPPLAVGIAVICVFGFASQYFYLAADRRANAFLALLIVFGWLFPLMAGGLLTNVDEDIANVVIALSPITGIANAGGVSIDNTDLKTIQVAAIAPWTILGLLFGILLLFAERKLSERVHAENDGQPRRREHTE